MRQSPVILRIHCGNLNSMSVTMVLLGRSSRTTSCQTPKTFNYPYPGFPQIYPFRSDLRWAVRLRAEPGRFVGAAAKTAAEERGYEVTATPPVITSLRFRVTAVSSSYYSRSALEFGEVCASGVGGCSNPREYIFSSSFSFPGFRGFLRAFDVTTLDSEGVDSAINPGPNNDHLTLAWEAGEKLKARGGANRMLHSLEIRLRSSQSVAFTHTHRTRSSSMAGLG